MKRRDLPKAAALGAGVWTGVASSAGAEAAPRPAESCDVLVVGGGSAGSIAAIQAARAGARTVLVEIGSQPGGTTTSGGVSFPGLFHAWGKQVIAGIGWDLVCKAVELDSGTLPDFSQVPPRHSMHQVRINGPLYAALAEEACLEAGVKLCYYQFPLSGQAAAGGWEIEIAGPAVRWICQARQLVDATGGADLAGMLGLARLRETTTQPGTLIFKFGNYDVAKLDRDLVERRYREAFAAGTLQPGDYASAKGRFISFLAGGGSNAQHVFGADSSTAATRTAANIAGRRSALRLLRFIRSLPGCENARILSMQAETGVRETHRIAGETLITVEDFTSGRKFPDAVCHSFYPVDLHDEKGVEPQPLRPGTVPTIPLRALAPKGCRNFLVAGRSVSSDRLANSALRVQASCMAMGQAAGAAAALAARLGASPLEVPFDSLCALLREHGAIVP